jgi:hypothetical protein
MAKLKWVLLNEGGETRKSTRTARRFVRVEPGRTYSRDEVEQLLRKAAQAASVNVDVLPEGVTRLDIDGARRERQAKIERTMREQADSVVINDADGMVHFARGGRETGRSGDGSIAKGQRASIVDVFEQPTVNPFGVSKGGKSEIGQITPNRRSRRVRR